LPDPWEPWRVEADDHWLAGHSGDVFARIRRVFHPLTGGADAVSHSVLGGILGGTPRNPDLKVRGVQAEQVRYAEKLYAYTTVAVELNACRRCEGVLEERHRLLLVDVHGGRTQVGSTRKCRSCDADSWMFTSHMPSARRRHREHARVVL
jgi:hypothetical protein